MKHEWETCNCNNPGCWICDGGLAICVKCHLIEGSLTTDCPGVPSYEKYGDAVYKGQVDFVRDGWVKGVSPYSPVHYQRRQEAVEALG